MNLRETWHLPPDWSSLLVALLWLATIVSLGIVAVRIVGLSRALAKDRENHAIAELRSGLVRGFVYATLGAVLILLVVLAGVQLRWMKGVTGEAVLTSKRLEKGRSEVHRVLTVESERVGTRELWVPHSVYESLEIGARVPIVVVPGVDVATQLGSRPSVNAALVVIAGLLLMIPIANVLVLPWRARE